MTITQQSTIPPFESDHLPMLSRFNAWFFDTITNYANFVARGHKDAAFVDIEPGRILEIGAGTGANFSYLPPGSEVVALEPNIAMHQRLQRRAKSQNVAIELLDAPAEAIPLADNSVDTVVCTLVLCTVDDIDAVLREIKRVLRPGGTMRFVEHVAADHRSPHRWLQRALARPWSWLFVGCCLCRDTVRALEAVGFGSLEIQRRRFRLSVFVPVNSAIHGIAAK